MKTMVYSVSYYLTDTLNTHRKLYNIKTFINHTSEHEAILDIMLSYSDNGYFVQSISFIASELHEQILN